MSAPTRTELVENVKKWIALDKEIHTMKRTLKERIAAHKSLAATIIQIMKSDSVDSYNIAGGAIIHKQRRSKRAISKKYLESEIYKYFVTDPSGAQNILETILNNRGEIVKDCLERKVIGAVADK